MSTLDVRIIELPAMKLACASGFGSSPEEQAWNKLFEWARQRGLTMEGRRYFGFNNPSPTPGSPNYGYDQWITLHDSEQVDSGEAVTPIDFPGGLYAVYGCRLSEIGEAWQSLVRWLEASPYRMGEHQWLEEVLNQYPSAEGAAQSGPAASPETTLFDLYMPIRK